MTASLHGDDADPGFQIAPMVDVVFVLMLFFMACAAVRVNERELGLNLPAGHGKAVLIEVVVAADGAVLLNGKLMGNAQDRALPALTGWLRNSRETFGDGDALIIRPAPTTPHERLMEVLSAAAAAGWRNVTFG